MGAGQGGSNRPDLLVVHSGEGMKGLKEGVTSAVVRAVGQFSGIQATSSSVSSLCWDEARGGAMGGGRAVLRRGHQTAK